MNDIRALYLHIPFCRRLCHYCDFAKTALFDDQKVRRYFDKLYEYINLAIGKGWIRQLDSVFLGGGTPGLFAREYDALFHLLAPHIHAQTEISIETNPIDLTREKLRDWQSLGINRLSLGVQTFSESGLKFLTRDHSAAEARQAIENALAVFANVNVDLIYGWTGQTAAIWDQDLDICLKLQIPHLSCYSLTFEPGTTLGRKAKRGVVQVTDDDTYADLYDLAKERLAHYEHEEISNWSLSGFSCRHNWTYWSGSPYLGFGIGAHGLLPDNGTGCRYAFHKSLKNFADGQADSFFNRLSSPELCTFEQRDDSAFIIESIVVGFRTKVGCNLEQLERVGARRFDPSPFVQDAIATGKIIKEGSMIRLHRDEWIRENYWCSKLLECFIPQPCQ